MSGPFSCLYILYFCKLKDEYNPIFKLLIQMKNTISLLLILSLIMVSCGKEDETTDPEGIYKQRMREFVMNISQYSKTLKPDFNVIPQNGLELISDNGDDSGQPNVAYLNAIDANGQEDLFFGYNADDQATPDQENAYLITFLNMSKKAGNTILVTDYCSTTAKVVSSYSQNAHAGYVSFAANKRELNTIPTFPTPIPMENANVITKMSEVKNFLYLLNLSAYNSKTDFIHAVTATNYDLLVTDLFFNDGSSFTTDEINQLRNKANGGKRLVISYMSIGEAEDYRYYWKSTWSTLPPEWLAAENPNWKGNYKVKYWNREWQNIIYGNDTSYTKRIIDAGFDGVYLDIIDAFEFFEE